MAAPLFFDTALRTLPAVPEEAVEHGEVFTRRWVVDLTLDLVGYTADKALCDVKLIEPACGSGAFLGVVAQRISASCRKQNRPIGDALGAVRALGLLERNVQASREVVEWQLVDEGWQPEEARDVAAAWVEQGDYGGSGAGVIRGSAGAGSPQGLLRRAATAGGAGGPRITAGCP